MFTHEPQRPIAGHGPTVEARPAAVATRRTAVVLLIACAALVAALLAPGSALAARSFDSRISGPGLERVFSIDFDGNGNFWAVSGEFSIFKYGPYPSQSLVEEVNTQEAFGFSVRDTSGAVDQSTGDVFVAQANGRSVAIYHEGKLLTKWTGINGVSACCPGDIHIAIDNSDTVSQGRVYLALSAPENDVEVLDAQQRPVQLPATASYIDGNRLTGTPSGPFGKVEQLAVDDSGNLFVVDSDKGVIDEFDSTGTFVRTFPDPTANGGYNPISGAVGVDPTNGNVLIQGESPEALEEYDQYGNHLASYTEDIPPHQLTTFGELGVNDDGYAYVGIGSPGGVDIFSPAPVVPGIAYRPVSAPTTTSGTLNAEIDPRTGGSVTACRFEFETKEQREAGKPYELATKKACAPDPTSTPPASNFTVPTDVGAAISGLTSGVTYYYRVVAENAGGVSYGSDRTYTPGPVLGLETDPVTALTESSATLNGSFVGNGEGTHYYFEWGPTASYGHLTASAPGDDAGSPAGPPRTEVSADVEGLNPYSTYHYRVIATNGGGTTTGPDQKFTTLPGIPTGRGVAATEVHADRAVLHAEVNPNGGHTGAHFEYVGDAQFQENGWEDAVSAPASDVGMGFGRQYSSISISVSGLQAGTKYHYRVVGTNATGSGSSEATFTTFPFVAAVNDLCPNAHERQQTGASLLRDCRAYELVSAANAGGYDVESDLAPNQKPFGGFPEAIGPSQVLYGVHDGGIPGTGNTTNHGVDPYVATRSADGWSTRYVGIPADQPGSNGPFASTVAGADSHLGTFAFGGSEVCSPCFPDGSTGIPLHLPDGSLVQGMGGSLDVPKPESSGEIAKPLSADGSHLVFGSMQRFEPGGNNEDGNLTIYSRDITTGGTEVVSTDQNGATLKDGTDVAELDVSEDGTRTLIGDLEGEEGQNKLWHLYLHIAGSPASIDLTPGTAKGALFDGMTENGSIVYFTSRDNYAGDTDESADVFRTEIGDSSVTVTRVSTGIGGTGDVDSCVPAANTIRSHWNTVGSEANCDAVAVGGGGGVTRGHGSIYFLSPELLDGASNGVAGAPNLYIAAPGSAPHFIRTLESNANAPIPPSAHPFVRAFGQGAYLNPAGVAIDGSNGDVYVFDIGNNSTANHGFIYKYDGEGHTDTGFAENGKLIVTGTFGEYGAGLPAGIAVDNDPTSPHYRDLFVPDLLGEAVHVFSPTGEHVTDLTVPFATAVAVNPSNGNVYVSSFFGFVMEFDPSGSLVGFFEPSLPSVTGIAVDSAGTVYLVNGGGIENAKGSAKAYSSTGTELGTVDKGPAYGISVDPTDDHVYVNEGDRVVEFGAASGPPWESIGSPTGASRISESLGVGVDAGKVYITNHNPVEVLSYGPSSTPPDPLTDNPLVIYSVSAAGVRKPGDFQVAPRGDAAVLVSTLPLSGYDNAGHSEVFRYDPVGDAVDCASCNPTGEQATGDASLASNGLSLTADGRVFFNSAEGLADRDLNGKEDAYEWEPNGFEFGRGAPSCHEELGCVELLSAGASLYASSLLSVSEDGGDAYFFTRQKLSQQDENGNTVKIYDARELGGFPFVPQAVQCKASDECHGPASRTPAAPLITSISRAPGGNAAAQRCDARDLDLKAKRLAHRAHALRKRAQRASSADEKARLRRRARRAQSRARQLSAAAKSCRTGQGASSGSRRAK
jgi:sugar lactone lactonase YvrE